MQILNVNGKYIFDGAKQFTLKGVNLGGWLMPEGYIMHAPNKGYHLFKAAFIKAHGAKVFAELERNFRDNFIVERDIVLIKKMGFNSVRLPFHYGLIEKKAWQYSAEGLAYLDKAIAWARQHGLRVILDMHAVPGAQNHDWHSDSDGRALFWQKPDYQKRALVLWEFLADHYKDEEAVAGYDLLNEAEVADPRHLNAYYQEAIKSIRAVDKQHIIFVEGNHWAQDIACLDEFSDDNIVLGVHFYEPLEMVFNYVPGLKYPLGKGRQAWDKTFMSKRLQSLERIADKAKRPLWCGEFGVNGRGGLAGEDVWLRDILSVFKELDIHWTYWTWKAVKNHMFPDGIYSYYPNDLWVHRPGPRSGWDTWVDHWADNDQAMIASWGTKNFTLNKQLAEVFKNGC